VPELCLEFLIGGPFLLPNVLYNNVWIKFTRMASSPHSPVQGPSGWWFQRQFLYDDLVGADRGPHTPTWVRASLGKLFSCFLFYVFLLFYFFCDAKMLKFQKYLVSKNYQIKNVQFIKLFKVQNCSKCENGSKFIFFK
jgi:hypothetical protein